LAFLTENKAKLCKLFIITLVFEKNANFFRRKLSKIAENCDHNIGPREWIRWQLFADKNSTDFSRCERKLDFFKSWKSRDKKSQKWCGQKGAIWQIFVSFCKI
jgi:hypothetical protein